jgi:hypothetical protein
VASDQRAARSIWAAFKEVRRAKSAPPDHATAAKGPRPPDPTPAQEAAAFESDLQRMGILLVAVALVAVGAYAVQFPFRTAFSVLGAAAATGACAAAIGAFLGFLFGIPEVLQSQDLGGRPMLYLANTDIEQISDWLTKILVGVGLVQLGHAPDSLGRLGNSLGPLFGGKDTSAGFALAFCLYFTVSSFLLSYLWFRALFRRFLQYADADVGAKVLSILESREAANAGALSAVDRQLRGVQPPTQAELDEAMSSSSPEWLGQIFGRAEQQRHSTWQKAPSEMERTIPVFLALVANDKQRRFQRHFGSLGYALKDKQPPDYKAAAENLSTAILIRGPAERFGWIHYEWNRAVCRIRLDPQFGQGAASTAEQAALIRSDLNVSRSLGNSYFPTAPVGDDDGSGTWAVGRWLELNGS